MPSKKNKPESESPESKPKEDIRSFANWAKVKDVEASAAGASIRFKIGLKEKMPEKEFDGYIAKWRKS